jgi:hypothetical protein
VRSSPSCRSTSARRGRTAPWRPKTDARNLVDRLGEPADIAAEAQRRFGRLTRPAAGGREIGALLLLGVGGLLVPVLAWVAGVVLLWTSESWNRRDKILGTAFTVGALPGLVLLGALLAVGSSGATLTYSGNGVTTGGVNDASSALSAVLGPLLLVTVLILPILTAG